jgi:hypothetical protein
MITFLHLQKIAERVHPAEIISKVSLGSVLASDHSCEVRKRIRYIA